MFCGTRSFSHVDWDDGSPGSKTLSQSLSVAKKKRRKKQSSKQNPYSTTGLDRFEKILQELDKQKEKVMLRSKSFGDATVRFTYKMGSEDWIPIIIRKKEAEEEVNEKARRRTTTEANVVPKRLEVMPSLKVRESKGVLVNKTRVVGREPRSWCWLLVIVLILGLLMFGRSFAICWTTMLWYLVPMVRGGPSKGSRRKELGR